MNVFPKPTELKDLVRTVAIGDALQSKCNEAEREKVADHKDVQHFALIKTTCKIVKSAPYRLDH